MSENGAGFRLFRAPYYRPAVEVVPESAAVDPFDEANPGLQRFAHWRDDSGRKHEIRLVRASKGRHAGTDLAAFESRTWTVEFADAHEKTRRLALFTSKSASAETARRLVQLVADVQAHGRLADPALTKWVVGLPDRIRRRLAGWHLIDAGRASVGKTLEDLLGSWQAALLAKGSTKKQAQQQFTRAKRLCDLAGFKRLVDITRGKVEATLARMREGAIEGERRIGQRTSNGYMQAVHSLCRWAVREGLIGENPIAGAEHVKVTDATQRRALTPDEQRALIEAARTGPERFGVDGPSRAILYATALGTGFQALRAGRASGGATSILGGDPPAVSLAASATKNRKSVVQPLPAELASLLKEGLGTQGARHTGIRHAPHL